MRGAVQLGALVLALVVAFPVVPVATARPAATSLPPPSATSFSAGAIPAALAAPWSARTGYSAGYLAEVPDAVPVAGSFDVVVSFWPASSSFFLPPGRAGLAEPDSVVATQYGLAPSAFAQARAYFTDEGLTTVRVAADRLSFTVDGPAAAIDRAFGTTVLGGAWRGHTVQFPSSPATLPGWLEPHVAAISGLSNGFSEFSFDLAPAPQPDLVAPAQGRTSSYITPSAAHMLYGLSDLYNATGGPHFAQGIGIAVVLWGDGYDPNDLTSFFSQYYPAGFPAVTLAYHPVDGAPDPGPSATSDPSNAPQELTLDLEWAGSAAPGAALTAVYAPDGPVSNSYSPTDADLEDALNTAIDTAGVNVVSMSFGTPDGGDAALQAQFALSLSRAAQMGITVLAASGDNGGTSSANCGGGPSPEFPAASPSVLAVGGTAPVESLDAFGDVTGLDSEPAWNGSGGGYSVDYLAPSWQTNTSVSGHRGIPDVAGPAFDDAFYYTGALKAGRGTSFATPMWAGLIAELDAQLGHSLGDLTPRLYAIGAAEAQGQTGPGLVDITSGANCIASATSGWDDVTGWGSPRGLALLHDLSSSFVDVALTTASGTTAPGGNVAASVTVLNASSHRPIAGLNVVFTLAATGYTGPCGGSFGTATATTDANGNASASLAISGCYLGSLAVLNVVASSRGFYGNNSTTIGVNLLGLAGFLAFAQAFPYNVALFAAIILAAVGLAYFLGERNRRRLGRTRRTVARRAAPGRVGPPPAPRAPPPAPPAPPPPAEVNPAMVLPAAVPPPPEPDETSADPADAVSIPDHVAAPPDDAPPRIEAGDLLPPTEDPSGAPAAGVPAHLLDISPAATCANCGASLLAPGVVCPVCGQ